MYTGARAFWIHEEFDVGARRHLPAQTPEEARDRYKAIHLQLLRHRFWTAALRTPYGGPWVGGTVNRLITLAGAEKGAKVSLVAFTATRCLQVRGVHRPRPDGREAEVTAKSRGGLVRVEALEVLEYGRASWPPGLKLRLVYADNEELVLGEDGKANSDMEAPTRVVDSYASLLADLTSARA